MTAYENKITLGELEDDCDAILDDVADGTTYLIVDENNDVLAVLVPPHMYDDSTE